MYELSDAIGPNLIQVLSAFKARFHLKIQVLEKIDCEETDWNYLSQENPETFECKQEECFNENFCDHFVILTLYILCYQNYDL